MLTNAVSPAQDLAVLSVVFTHQQKELECEGLLLLQSRNSEVDHQKWSGSVGAERPTDPATSREFANLLKKVAPETHFLCVSAPGDEVSLITLKLEVTTDMSLRALVDCGASNNFVRRQSLEAGSFTFVEREIPPTNMTVRLATGASITVKKRVVGIHYTLKGEQYDDDFIVLDLDYKFDVILGLPWLRKYKPRVSWQCRSVTIPATCSSVNHLDEHLGTPTFTWVYYE